MEKFVEPKEAVPEVTKYFVESWGNRKRIDYGTGHEASFLAWLYCLHRLRLIKQEDFKAVVIKVFFKYVVNPIWPVHCRPHRCSLGMTTNQDTMS
jgi:serine/threonine-protein phosphatase 2A activator